jgi:hypothetical protein
MNGVIAVDSEETSEESAERWNGTAVVSNERVPIWETAGAWKSTHPGMLLGWSQEWSNILQRLRPQSVTITIPRLV